MFTIRKASVGYEHRGRLFGHDLPKPGKVHACDPEAARFVPHVGTVYTTLCGERVNAARADVATDGQETAITCRRCRKLIGVR